jgi:hypothetical protein
MKLSELMAPSHVAKKEKSKDLHSLIASYADASNNAFEDGHMGNDEEAEANEDRAADILADIQNRFGASAVKKAEEAAYAAIFGRTHDKYHPNSKDELDTGWKSKQLLTKKGKLYKIQQDAIKNRIKNRKLSGPKELPESLLD